MWKPTAVTGRYWNLKNIKKLKENKAVFLTKTGKRKTENEKIIDFSFSDLC